MYALVKWRLCYTLGCKVKEVIVEARGIPHVQLTFLSMKFEQAN
jgi:hypothetical protein